MSIADKLTSIAENMQGVYDKGYADGLTNFQDFVNLQTGVETNRTDLSYCFQYSNHEELNIENDRILTLGYCFRGATKLKKITFLPNATSGCTSFGYAFNNTPNLDTVENLDLTSATSANQTFNQCGLVNLTLTGTISFDLDIRSLSKVTRNSLINIFNALIDRTGDNQGHLLIGGTNLNKVSEEDLLIAHNKNWGVS